MIEISAETVAELRKRGGTWAIYQNEALDSAEAGKVVCLRYGPGCTLEEAPERMPDTPQYGPGWKYQLVDTIDADSLPENPDGLPMFVHRRAPQ